MVRKTVVRRSLRRRAKAASGDGTGSGAVADDSAPQATPEKSPAKAGKSPAKEKTAVRSGDGTDGKDTSVAPDVEVAASASTKDGKGAGNDPEVSASDSAADKDVGRSGKSEGKDDDAVGEGEKAGKEQEEPKSCVSDVVESAGEKGGARDGTAAGNDDNAPATDDASAAKGGQEGKCDAGKGDGAAGQEETSGGDRAAPNPESSHSAKGGEGAMVKDGDVAGDEGKAVQNKEAPKPDDPASVGSAGDGGKDAAGERRLKGKDQHEREPDDSAEGAGDGENGAGKGSDADGLAIKKDDAAPKGKYSAPVESNEGNKDVAGDGETAKMDQEATKPDTSAAMGDIGDGENDVGMNDAAAGDGNVEENDKEAPKHNDSAAGGVAGSENDVDMVDGVAVDGEAGGKDQEAPKHSDLATKEGDGDNSAAKDDTGPCEETPTGTTPSPSLSSSPTPAVLDASAVGQEAKRAAPQSQESQPGATPDDSRSRSPTAQARPVRSEQKEKKEPFWREAQLDAEELETLAFSVRRRTARARLMALVTNMRQVSEQARRAEMIKAYQEAEKRAQSGSAEAQGSDSKSGEQAGAAPEKRKSEDIRAKADSSSETKEPGASPAPAKKLKAAEGAASAKAENPSRDKPFVMDRSAFLSPPVLKAKDKWVQHNLSSSELFCPDFEKSHTCPLKTECDRVHVFRVPYTPGVDPLKGMTRYTREDLEKAYKDHMSVPLQAADFQEKIKPDTLNRPRYSSALVCPVNKIYYYAAGGSGGERSEQGIWWYPTMKEGRDNVATIVIQHLKETGALPKNFAGVAKKAPATRTERRLKQPSVRRDHRAPPPKDTRFRQPTARVQLPPPPPPPMSIPGNPSSFRVSSRPLPPGNPMAIQVPPQPMNPPGNPVPFQSSNVRPFPGNAGAIVAMNPPRNRVFQPSQPRSLPGNAVAVAAPYQPPAPDCSLPDVEPWNWMERGYSRRCEYFNNKPPKPQCTFGDKCSYAHVYFPKHIPTNTFPHPDALSYAYEKEFGVKLDGLGANPFCSTGVVDSTGRIWYAAAFTCPVEKTIYYAAGGPSGRVNGQNMFLYPSGKDATLAVSGVVLNAFSTRGMHCSWEQPPRPAMQAYPPVNPGNFGSY